MSVVCFFIALCLAMCGCCDEQLVEGTNSSEFIEGELVDASLCISVDEFKVNMQTGTRAIEGTENENKINDIWIFQFDASTGQKLIENPIYLEEKEDMPLDLSDLPVKLAVNASGEKSIIYVVANTGSDQWGNNSDFTQLSKLEEATLPSAGPIRVGGLIPMGGYVQEIVTVGSKIEVPVIRMYAKLEIDVAVNISNMDLENFTVNNIPQVCQIGTKYNNETKEAGADYSNAITDWAEDIFSDKQATLYVPENIQGIRVNTGNKNLVAPRFALEIIARLKGEIETGFQENRSYTVYPGENTINDFNIKRNHIYNITLNINSLGTEKGSPSANCFVIKQGSSIAFEPYYRTEIGGPEDENLAKEYRIENYLNPDEEGKQIKRVDIIWQTPDAIGDNSTGNLVWYNENTQKIYVKPMTDNKPGNALIAAFDSKDAGKGNILWSWHIWVIPSEMNDPSDEAHSITYRTYEWDSQGIYHTRPRKLGLPIMNCNLGALAYKPSKNYDPKPFGMLYQWGRKDPFPPFTIYDQVLTREEYTEAHVGPVYDNANKTQVGMTSDFEENKLFHALPAAKTERIGLASENPILYTVQNPTVFMCGTEQAKPMPETQTSGFGNNYLQNQSLYPYRGDWADLNRAELNEQYGRDDLWGGKPPKNDIKHYVVHESNPTASIYDNYGAHKTIFDPCPKGWRVPPGELWLGFTINGLNPQPDETAGMGDINYNPDYSEYSHENGMALYMTDWREGVTSYFPLQGTLTGNGRMNQTGQCGNYHNATTDVGGRVNILHVHNHQSLFKVFEYDWYFYYIKSTGGPIRCVIDRNDRDE